MPVALITGTSTGIGLATALHFGREGHDVWAGVRNPAAATDLRAAIDKERLPVRILALDVDDEGSVQRGVAEVLDKAGRVDVLVNNAGIGGGNRIEDTTLADWERIMAVNSTGVFLGTRAVIPAMRRAGGGSIVNISSQLGLVGTDNSSPQYQASKGSVRLLTKATAIQYAKDGIRANSVHPGPIVTAMTERRRADPETYRLTVSRIPLGRYGQPVEVALGVLYLASDEASFVTGSELLIDGGWTAQ
jgi:cyclopentanol dehydrogenase